MKLGVERRATCVGGWLLEELPASTPPAAPRATANATATEKTYLFKSIFLQISRDKAAPE
jgi:hypothetical protein